MTARPYFIDGIQLVNTGGELCEACGQRKAVAASVAGHVLCVRCAGMAAVLAEEYAAEVEASRERATTRRDQTRAIMAQVVARLEDSSVKSHRYAAGQRSRERADALTHFPCGHERTTANTYKRSDNRRACRECRRVRSKAAKAAARQRERTRIGRAS
jgi:hypothetical protein